MPFFQTRGPIFRPTSRKQGKSRVRKARLCLCGACPKHLEYYISVLGDKLVGMEVDDDVRVVSSDEANNSSQMEHHLIQSQLGLDVSSQNTTDLPLDDFVIISKLVNSGLTFDITDSKQKSILEEYQICFRTFCLGGFLYIRLIFKYIRLCRHREYWD